MLKQYAYEWEADNGTLWVNIYSVPNDAPEDLTEGQAEDYDPAPLCILAME